MKQNGNDALEMYSIFQVQIHTNINISSTQTPSVIISYPVTSPSLITSPAAALIPTVIIRLVILLIIRMVESRVRGIRGPLGDRLLCILVHGCKPSLAISPANIVKRLVVMSVMTSPVSPTTTAAGPLRSPSALAPEVPTTSSSTTPTKTTATSPIPSPTDLWKVILVVIIAIKIPPTATRTSRRMVVMVPLSRPEIILMSGMLPLRSSKVTAVVRTLSMTRPINAQQHFFGNLCLKHKRLLRRNRLPVLNLCGIRVSRAPPEGEDDQWDRVSSVV